MLQIIVLVDRPPTMAQNKIVAILRDNKYSPLVDARHRGDIEWLKQFDDIPHLKFNIEKCGSECPDPDIIIHFNLNETSNVFENDWTIIRGYFSWMFFGVSPPHDITRRVRALLEPLSQLRLELPPLPVENEEE